MNKKTLIEKVEEIENGQIKITALMDKQELAQEFAPYYDIQEEIKRAVLPILTEEVLKNKDEIVKKVLLEVNWPDVVRSEVAQRVIKEIAKSY